MKILGINALNHDAAIAMIQDGEVLFAGHSERYSGVKNDSDLNAALLADSFRHGGKPEGLWTWYTNRDERICEVYFKNGKKENVKHWIPQYTEIGLE